MNVRNCRRCGRLFNYVMGSNICPKCKEETEVKYQEVKKYVREHRTANMTDVADDCDVELSQIQQWIREERLEFTADSPIKIPCENCGEPIGSGRYCAKCKNDMTRNLSSVLPKAPKQEPVNKPKDAKENKMRFLDN